MIFALVPAWATPPIYDLDIPFPATRVFTDQRDKVCLRLRLDAKPMTSDTQMSDFDVACTLRAGWMSVCLTLSEPNWPKEPPPIECGPDEAVVRMRPVPAYLPNESIWDGVHILRRVDIYKAAYRVDHPDAPGLMYRGKCGISDGLFWFDTERTAVEQECILVMADHTERVIPIRLVRRLRPLGE